MQCNLAFRTWSRHDSQPKKSIKWSKNMHHWTIGYTNKYQLLSHDLTGTPPTKYDENSEFVTRQQILGIKEFLAAKTVTWDDWDFRVWRITLRWRSRVSSFGAMMSVLDWHIDVTKFWWWFILSCNSHFHRFGWNSATINMHPLITFHNITAQCWSRKAYVSYASVSAAKTTDGGGFPRSRSYSKSFPESNYNECNPTSSPAATWNSEPSYFDEV